MDADDEGTWQGGGSPAPSSIAPEASILGSMPIHVGARRRAVRTLVATGVLFLLPSCGDGSDNSAPRDGSNPYNLTETGPAVLSVTPLDTATIFAITPLGSIAPVGHVLPTDHVYISFVDPWNGQQQLNDCRARPVRAAGTGVVTFVLVTEAQGDTKLDVQMTKTFHYYYDHVLLRSGIAVGSRVTAGDTIGTTTGRCPSMDLGVYDLGMTAPGLVNTRRYAGSSLHVLPPLRYFNEPLRAFLYSRVRLFEGVPADKDGRTDWGVSGTLAGDWFHSSLANDSASVIGGPSGWPKSISFAYEWFAHAPRISIGGTIGTPGVLRIADTDPDFAAVRVASGMVVYQGTPVLGGITAGWVAVQMFGDARIRIEYVPGAVKPTAFSSAAQEFVR